MQERVVICLRAGPGPGRPFLERARALVRRYGAIGGVHVGFDAMALAFAFEPSAGAAILEAIATPGPETEGAEVRWAVGIAQGAIERVEEHGSPLLSSGALWWGAPIVTASALARLAGPGEILCAEDVEALLPSGAPTSEVRTARDGALHVRAVRIDARRRLPAIDVAPGASSSGDGARIAAAELGELTRRALLADDDGSLERLVDGLRAAGESPVLTERMRAMARLGRGDVGDALRALRRTRAELDPSDVRRRCQTSLALGIVLSVAGRPEEALLEGMDALARAREEGDAHGVRACLAFLAKLYASVARETDSGRLREAAG